MTPARFTPREIESIRNDRAFFIPWEVIAKSRGRSVAEVRAALNLPQYDESKAIKRVLPWDVQTKDLFSGQEQGE